MLKRAYRLIERIGENNRTILVFTKRNFTSSSLVNLTNVACIKDERIYEVFVFVDYRQTSFSSKLLTLKYTLQERKMATSWTFLHVLKLLFLAFELRWTFDIWPVCDNFICAASIQLYVYETFLSKVKFISINCDAFEEKKTNKSTQ